MWVILINVLLVVLTVTTGKHLKSIYWFYLLRSLYFESIHRKCRCAPVAVAPFESQCADADVTWLGREVFVNPVSPRQRHVEEPLTFFRGAAQRISSAGRAANLWRSTETAAGAGFASSLLETRTRTPEEGNDSKRVRPPLFMSRRRGRRRGRPSANPRQQPHTYKMAAFSKESFQWKQTAPR